MADEQSDKVVEKSKPKPKKPPGYREFEKLLKKVITAPPYQKSGAPHT